MGTEEIFGSALRSQGDLAGVFEYDADSSYFYLYSTGDGEPQRVKASMRVRVEPPALREGEAAVRWDRTEQRVALFIRGRIYAAFDAMTGARYGGTDAAPMPADIVASFSSS